MSRADSGADGAKPAGRAGPAGRAMLKEILGLRSKAIRIIDRQVDDLKTASSYSEERELLEHIDLCISIASRLSRYANAFTSDPAGADGPDVRRFVIDASLLLSQHEDEAAGK